MLLTLQNLSCSTTRPSEVAQSSFPDYLHHFSYYLVLFYWGNFLKCGSLHYMNSTEFAFLDEHRRKTPFSWFCLEFTGDLDRVTFPLLLSSFCDKISIFSPIYDYFVFEFPESFLCHELRI